MDTNRIDTTTTNSQIVMPLAPYRTRGIITLALSIIEVPLIVISAFVYIFFNYYWTLLASIGFLPDAHVSFTTRLITPIMAAVVVGSFTAYNIRLGIYMLRTKEDVNPTAIWLSLVISIVALLFCLPAIWFAPNIFNIF